MRRILNYISHRDGLLLALCVGLAAAACRLGTVV